MSRLNKNIANKNGNAHPNTPPCPVLFGNANPNHTRKHNTPNPIKNI